MAKKLTDKQAAEALKLLQQLRKVEGKEQAQGDIVYFVEHYCHIEDKDAPGVIIPFGLWEGQRRVLRSIDDNRLNIILKARQLGMTWLALSYAARELIFRPGCSVIGLSRTEDEAKELVRRLGVIFRHIPDLLEIDGLIVKATALTLDIIHRNNLISTFKAFPSSPSAGRSFTANLIILDEWAYQQYDREIWTAVYPTINRPTGGKVIGLSTIERGSLFEEIYTNATEYGFNALFLPWDTDPRRTPEWYEATKKAMGDLIMQEYPSSVAEALTIPGGAFFPELRRHLHVVPKREIPSHYARYVSIDYGLDALAAIWYAVDRYGNAEIYKEVYKSGLIASDAAKAILEANEGEKIDCYYAPPDLWGRNRDTGRSTAEIFADYGIFLCKTSNSREQGWLDVKEWLTPVETTNEQTGEATLRPRLVIHEGVTELWRCLVSIQRDKHNPRDCAKDPHELTHLPDSLRAFCAGRPLPAAAARDDAVYDDDDLPEFEEQVRDFLNYGVI